MGRQDQGSCRWSSAVGATYKCVAQEAIQVIQWTKFPSPPLDPALYRHPHPYTGGYAVLKGIQERLKLPTDKMIPSFATLHEYGNTSCSTTW